MPDQNEFERLTGGAVIPKMQAVDKGDAEKRGAPIPNMQPAQDQTSANGEQSTGATESGEGGNKK